MELTEALENAADGAFIVDEDLQIIYWNPAAQEIVGFKKHQVVGSLCYQVLHGRNEEGRLICEEHCSVVGLALRGEPIANYDVQIQEKLGKSRWLNISIFSYPKEREDGRALIVHLFRDITRKKEDERFLQKIIQVARRYHKLDPEAGTESEDHPLLDELTPREYEILSLLARGRSTQDIALTLSISPNTVRNHIQHILQKLHIHSRVEAVTYAIKHGLVD